jgi:hypothetical protein
VSCYRVILGDLSRQRLAVVRTDKRVFVHDVFIVHLRLIVSNVTVTSVNNEWQMPGRKRPFNNLIAPPEVGVGCG